MTRPPFFLLGVGVLAVLIGIWLSSDVEAKGGILLVGVVWALVGLGWLVSDWIRKRSP